MGPALPLPLHDEWEDVDSYIEALLNFATSTPLFLNLCGGVHILDFLTSEPDLYTTLIAADWRAFFHEHDLYDILDLILSDDISTFRHPGGGWKTQKDINAQETWKNGPLPPASLLDYIHDVRRFSLRRDFTPPTPPDDATTTVTSPVPHRLAFGMKDKKLHEVEHFSRYVDSFAASVSDLRQEPITHIADFGSGQNYLGRTLAYSFNRNIIAIERKHDFIKGAQGMDVVTRVAKKKVVRMYNKKAAMALQREKRIAIDDAGEVCESCLSEETANNSVEKATPKQQDEEEGEEDHETVFRVFSDLNLDVSDLSSKKTQASRKPYEQIDLQPRGTMNYIEHNIKDGYLEPIIRHVVEPAAEEGQKTSTTAAISEQSKATPSSDTPNTSQQARVLVVSLHSCGNLLHHGIRSLILNPSVVAIAMIGCCYNLLTERLGPATYKLPVLRHMHQRLSVGATEKDPHGFPMSNLFENYTYAGGKGIKFNITARMMACQAPFNWSREETEAFFLRHYYRALLQKFFVDHGVAPKPQLATLDVLTKGHSSPAESNGANGNDQNTWDTSPPLVIGTLRKTAYKSFTTYAQAAMAKLAKEPAHFSKLAPLLENEVATLDELEQYVATYKYAKKNLSIVWVLMSFSAMLVEAMIVIDRWQYLREHMASGVVKECWVEPVFDYAQSPRNLAVIGIKK